ncbi:MAG: hypothetical protein AAF928_00325 [Myxococcota bacterium]
MWVRSAAIRPVGPEARVSSEILDEVEAFFGEEEEHTEARLTDTFKAFENAQPHLSAHIEARLSRTGDDMAMALGYFLSLAVWMAFDRAHGSQLERVEPMGLDSVEQALALDEELRSQDPTDGIESDDVVAMEQPDAIQFLQEHIDAALELNAADANVDAVHRVYRLLLVEVLALSYAVRRSVDDHEIQA